MLEWQYSRNRRRHYVDDGEKYGPNFYDLFEIRDNAPEHQIHRPHHGYRLLHKGKFVDQFQKVKTLKESAERIHAKILTTGSTWNILRRGPKVTDQN